MKYYKKYEKQWNIWKYETATSRDRTLASHVNKKRFRKWTETIQSNFSQDRTLDIMLASAFVKRGRLAQKEKIEITNGLSRDRTLTWHVHEARPETLACTVHSRWPKAVSTIFFVKTVVVQYALSFFSRNRQNIYGWTHLETRNTNLPLFSAKTPRIKRIEQEHFHASNFKLTYLMQFLSVFNEFHISVISNPRSTTLW